MYPRLVLVVAASACLWTASYSQAQIYRWDNGQVIPGTERITPGPGVILHGYDTDQSNLDFADLKAIDLNGASLTSARLRSSDFSGAILHKATLRDTNMTNAKLSRADLTNANLLGATLTNADLTDAIIQKADFLGVSGFTASQLYSTQSYKRHDLTGVRFTGLDISSWNLADQIIEGADFSGSTLIKDQLYSTASYQSRSLGAIGLAGTNLSGAHLVAQNLQSANLRAANLSDADFTDADIRYASLGRGWDTSLQQPTGTGISLSQLYSTASYKNKDLSGIVLSTVDMTGANFRQIVLRDAIFFSGRSPATLLRQADFTGADLSFASFGGGVFTAPADFTNADFSDAIIWGADLGATVLSANQMYSTASYKSGALGPIVIDGNNLDGWDFSFQSLPGAVFGTGSFFRHAASLVKADFQNADLRNSSFDGVDLSAANLSSAKLSGATFSLATLRNADMSYAVLAGAQLNSADVTNADFSFADLRGVMNNNFQGVRSLRNAILPDGRVNGLHLDSNEVFKVVDNDGGGPYLPPLMPIPITIRSSADFTQGSVGLIFEDDDWNSLISFEPNIPVQLGGVLRLAFADGIDVADEVGRTLRIFDWAGVGPTGQFTVTSPYKWDLSRLYTSGEVTLTAVPEPSSICLGLLSLLMLFGCRRSHRKVILFGVMLVAACALVPCAPGVADEFKLTEATIPDINAAFDKGTLTSETLVQMYLNRIAAYDNAGPTLNAMLTVNPDALEIARQLDSERSLSGPRSPLHGIPVVLKDNLDTKDLPTSAGNIGLRDSVPPDDAFLVRRLRDAGAIVLGKTNMDEFGFGVIGRSSAGGQTLNPYDLSKVPLGSSGGTAVAVTANFAAIGFGADAIGSVRMPASASSLVGLKPTLGLISRDGVMAYDVLRETAGPMARNVTDLAIVLDAVAGVDPSDPWTADSLGRVPDTYVTSLRKDAIQGRKFGRLGFSAARPMRDVADAGVQTLKALGGDIGTVVSLSFLPDTFDSLYDGFEHDMNRYLESLGPDRRFPHLDDLVESGEFLPLLSSFFGSLTKGDVSPANDPEYARMLGLRDTMRQRVLALMDEKGLDALVYPTLPVNPTTVRTNNRVWLGDGYFDTMNIASFLGFPAITVPAGFSSEGYPLGFEFMGRPYSDSDLLGYAYSFEQATHHRRPPSTTPPLPGETVPEPNCFAVAAVGAVLALLKVRRTAHFNSTL